MRIIGKVSVNHNQVSGWNQFIGVDDWATIDFENGSSPKSINAVCFLNLGIDAQYFLDKGEL